MRVAAFVGVAGAVSEAVGGVRLMAVAAPAVVDQVNVRAFPSIAVPDIPPIASMVPVVARGFRRSRPEATVHRISSVTSEPLTVPVTVQSRVGEPSTKPVPATAPVTLLLVVIVIEWTYVVPDAVSARALERDRVRPRQVPRREGGRDTRRPDERHREDGRSYGSLHLSGSSIPWR